MINQNASKPFFSIIIPVYNTGHLLEKCIESVITQDISSYEVLIINDGSTDNSEIICQTIVEKYENIRYFSKKNGGLSDARNVGLLNSKGEYIIFLDSDDIIQTGSLIKLVSVMKKYNNVEIFACNYLYCSHNSKSLIQYKGMDRKIYTGSDFLGIQLKNRSMSMSVCRNIYKLDFLKTNELFFYEGVYHEDEEWSPRAFLSAQSTIFVDDYFYIAIARENSITQKRDLRKNALDLIKIVERLDVYYKEIDNVELKKALQENNVEILLNAIYVGKFDKRFLKSNGYFKDILANATRFKTKLKIALLRLNLRLYFILNYVLKKISKGF